MQHLVTVWPHISVQYFSPINPEIINNNRPTLRSAPLAWWDQVWNPWAGADAGSHKLLQISFRQGIWHFDTRKLAQSTSLRKWLLWNKWLRPFPPQTWGMHSEVITCCGTLCSGTLGVFTHTVPAAQRLIEGQIYNFPQLQWTYRHQATNISSTCLI